MLAHRPGRNPVLLISLLAALMMVIAGCNALPSASAAEGEQEPTAAAPQDQGGQEGQDDGGLLDGVGDLLGGDDQQGGEQEPPADDQQGGQEPPADDQQGGEGEQPPGDDQGGEQPPGDGQDGEGEQPPGDDQGGQEPPADDQQGDEGEQPPGDDQQGGDDNQGQDDQNGDDEGDQGEGQEGDDNLPPPVDPPGEDPPQEEPDDEANQDQVEEETQDPDQDPCDPEGLPEHDGTQTADRGSAVCNRGAMGVLPAADKTPSIVITTPENGSEVRVGEDISVTVAFDNFTPGTFDDPNTQYGSRPFSIDENGNAVGHSHLYVQKLNEQDVPSAELDSFLALNEPSDDGTLSGDVPAVSEEGWYRLCTDVAGGNHLTFPKGNAQQGPQGDCIQFFAFNE